MASFLGSGLGHSDMAECAELRVVGRHGPAMVPFYRKEERSLRLASMPSALLLLWEDKVKRQAQHVSLWLLHKRGGWRSGPAVLLLLSQSSLLPKG